MCSLPEVMGTVLPHRGLMQSWQSAWEHISPEGIVPSWHPQWSSQGWVRGGGVQKHRDRREQTQRRTQARHPLRLFGFSATHADVIHHWPSRLIESPSLKLLYAPRSLPSQPYCRHSHVGACAWVWFSPEWGIHVKHTHLGNCQNSNS